MEASWPTPSDLYPSGWGGKPLQLGNNGEETKWLPPGSGKGERLLVRLVPPVFPPLECGRNQSVTGPLRSLLQVLEPVFCLHCPSPRELPPSSGLGYWCLPSFSGPGETFTSPNPQSRRETGSPEPERGAFPSLPLAALWLQMVPCHSTGTGQGRVWWHRQSRGLPEGSQGRLGMVAWSPDPLPRVSRASPMAHRASPAWEEEGRPPEAEEGSLQGQGGNCGGHQIFDLGQQNHSCFGLRKGRCW